MPWHKAQLRGLGIDVVRPVREGGTRTDRGRFGDPGVRHERLLRYKAVGMRRPCAVSAAGVTREALISVIASTCDERYPPLPEPTELATGRRPLGQPQALR